MYKAIDKWLFPYFRSALKRPACSRPQHIIFMIADHYEPLGPGGMQPIEKGVSRVERWQAELPRVVDGFRDSDGSIPKHTFFYPEEEYHPEILNRVSDMCSLGLGEVEIHLHHEKDTADGIRDKISGFRDTLHRDHQCLGTDAEGNVRYAFIHGNWALCNSMPDGRNCGVNNELPILKETGCYVDMTMPSGPSPTQSRIVNSIYYAADRPSENRSYDWGRLLHAGGEGEGRDDLLMVQGPIALNWGWRKRGLIPHLDYGDISGKAGPGNSRVSCWVAQHIHVIGRPDWLFVKVHTHGCVEENMAVLLGQPMREMHELLTTRYNDGDRFRLHYTTAREMVNIIKAAEAGERGEPGDYRDYWIKPPDVVGRQTAENSAS